MVVIVKSVERGVEGVCEIECIFRTTTTIIIIVFRPLKSKPSHREKLACHLKTPLNTWTRMRMRALSTTSRCVCACARAYHTCQARSLVELLQRKCF